MAPPSTAAVAAALPFPDSAGNTAGCKYSVAEFVKPKVGLKKSQLEAPLDLTFRSVSDALGQLEKFFQLLSSWSLSCVLSTWKGNARDAHRE